jgi:hypothetical protein
MENTDNQNNPYHIAHTKLFKSSFAGASGSKKCRNLQKTLALGVTMNRRRRKQIAFHDFPTGFTGAYSR